MTPLAPLRILFTGIFGLMMLGVGVYCLWQFADKMQPSPPVAVPQETSNSNPELLDQEVEGANQDGVVDQPSVPIDSKREIPAWAYLLSGLLLTSWSLLGRWPLMWSARLLSSHSQPSILASREKRVLLKRPDGTELNVETCGNINGQTVVFTHGWSLDSTSWCYAKELLGDRFRLVLWDLPGLGLSKSPRDKNFEIEKMASDLNAVVESVAGSQKVFLVGHSIGGMITQIYGGKYGDQLSERVAGIVLVHTTYTNPLRTMLGASIWTVIESMVIVPSQYLMLWLAPLAYLSNWQSYLNGSMQLTTRFTSFTGKQSFEQVDYAAWLSTNAWPAVVARGNLAMFRYDAQSALQQINVPLLVISGDRDRITKPSASDEINNLVSGSESARNSGGHLALFEFQTDVMARIESFVDSHAASQPVHSIP
jgi:pimeloyl-ACP methyl ester carboxylesterase